MTNHLVCRLDRRRKNTKTSTKQNAVLWKVETSVMGDSSYVLLSSEFVMQKFRMFAQFHLLCSSKAKVQISLRKQDHISRFNPLFSKMFSYNIDDP